MAQMATAQSSDVGTIFGVAFLVFVVGGAWLRRRIRKAPPEFSNRAISAGQASLGGMPLSWAAFWLWGALCLGGAGVALILVTGSPFGGSLSTSTPNRADGHPRLAHRLADLHAATDSPSTDYSKAAHALLITAANGPTEIDLDLGGRYRVLRATVAMKVTAAVDVAGRRMDIQLFPDTRSSGISYHVTPGSPAVRTHPIGLHGAQKLRIVVTDPGGSVNDEAVIAGVLRP